MIKINEIALPVNYDEEDLKKAAARKIGCCKRDIILVKILKKSLDARKKSDIHYVLSAAVEIKDEERLLKKGFEKYSPFKPLSVPAKKTQKRPVVVGFGPAGIFAACSFIRS